ncbi:MAG: hypothetical protein KKD48_02160 [Nanoarchaeota archaeon]|nr:hypothetical protein [Nanoarchaeota archaeon]
MIQQLKKQESENKIIRLFSISIAFIFIDTSIVLAIEYDLEYDTNGNLIQGKDKYFEYNTFNQLFKVRENNENGNILEEYYYDQDGNRILKIEYESGQVKQEIYYINENYIQIVNSTGTFSEVYYYDDSGLIAENGTDSKLKAYHSDHLGSTNLVTNESGSIVEEDYYEPYGSELQDSNSRYTYTGKEKDATGLMYYGARNYNPEQGQFIEPDKILAQVYDPQQLNRYAYARNNPYKYIDKEGKAIFDVNAQGNPASFLQVIADYQKVFVAKQERLKLAQTQLELGLRKEFGDLPKIQSSSVIGAYPSPNIMSTTRYTFYQLQEMKLSKSFNIQINQYQDVVGYKYEDRLVSVGLMEERGFEKSNIISEISSQYQQITGKTYEPSSIKRGISSAIHFGESLYTKINKLIGGRNSN